MVGEGGDLLEDLVDTEIDEIGDLDRRDVWRELFARSLLSGTFSQCRSHDHHGPSRARVEPLRNIESLGPGAAPPRARDH